MNQLEDIMDVISSSSSSFSEAVSRVACATFQDHLFRFNIMYAGPCNENQDRVEGNIEVCYQSIVLIFYSKQVRNTADEAFSKYNA